MVFWPNHLLVRERPFFPTDFKIWTFGFPLPTHDSRNLNKQKHKIRWLLIFLICTSNMHFCNLKHFFTTNGFWNPNNQMVVNHPPTPIRTLFRFWNPLKKMDAPLARLPLARGSSLYSLLPLGLKLNSLLGLISYSGYLVELFLTHCRRRQSQFFDCRHVISTVSTKENKIFGLNASSSL